MAKIFIQRMIDAIGQQLKEEQAEFLKYLLYVSSLNYATVQNGKDSFTSTLWISQYLDRFS